MNLMDVYSRYKDRIPSGLWLLILLCGILLIIAIPIAFIYLISHVEGVASIIFLVIGWLTFGRFAMQDKRKPLILAGAVLFYALMGMALDQPGNILYNQPLAFDCPAGTTFNRGILTLNPLPGRTDFVQNYQCMDGAGKPVHTISMGLVIITRFIEYIIIAYLLLGIRLVIKKIKTRFNNKPDTAV